MIDFYEIKAFRAYEVFILNIVLDNFFIDFVCVYLFLSGDGSSLKGEGSWERKGKDRNGIGI